MIRFGVGLVSYHSGLSVLSVLGYCFYFLVYKVQFSAIIPSNTFQSSSLFSPSVNAIMCRLAGFTLSHRSHMLLSLFSFAFLSAF